MQHIKNIYFYIFWLIVVISFVVHYYLLEQMQISLQDSKLIESYLINTILVAIYFLILKKYLNRIKGNVSSIFIIFSFLKFVLFFILINPTYKFDNKVSIIEFSSFFIPYFLCIIGEVMILSKLLNNLKF